MSHFSVGLWVLMGLVMMSGCTIAMPFRKAGTASNAGSPSAASATVIVGLTYVELGDDRRQNKVFWNHLERVNAVMDRQPGLVGHSLRRQVFGKKAWTMSVWESRQAMADFVASPEHMSAMKTGWYAVADGKFLVLELPREQAPLKWKDAERMLAEQGRAYGETSAYGAQGY